MKRNIIKICVLLILSAILLTACGEYKETNCVICGRHTNCYKVYYDMSHKYGDWVCSTKCASKAKDIYKGLKSFGDMLK